MKIECNRCQLTVDATVVAQAIIDQDLDAQPPISRCRYSLLKCPLCKNVLFAIEEDEYHSDGESVRIDLSSPFRAWPDPDPPLPLADPFYDPSDPKFDVSKATANAFKEAFECLKAKNYTACVAQCGRALEGICRSLLKSPKCSLGQGLRGLKENDFIDEKMFKWGSEVHEGRNQAAHGTDTIYDAEDARAVWDFTIAIYKYIYELEPKYKRFLERQKLSN